MSVTGDRTELLDALRKMSDEAFGYAILALVGVVKTNEANHGFTPESSESFVRLAFALNRCAREQLHYPEDIIDMDVVRTHNPMLFPNAKPSPASTGAIAPDNGKG